MVLLPEERGMTLAELRQIAARQQHQIEAQHQLLVAKEQRLKFLKQQEARHHNLSEQQLDTNCLLSLRDKVEAQEIKLRHLKALRGQVDQQKTNNSNLGTELDSIRALFCEKEKELDLAVSKVEELSRQLDEIKNHSRKNYLTPNSELENLRRELLYRTKLSEQQNNYICTQREKISNCQQDIAALDKKINELNERLHRKRLINDHFASQIHLASLSHNTNGSNLNIGKSTKAETKTQDLLERDHTQDDFSANLRAHKCDLGEFSLTKNDPKYQTLPYNTKFTLKEKHSDDSLSSTEDESSSSSKSENSVEQNNSNSYSNMCNFSPRPFSNNYNSNSGVQKVTLQINAEDSNADIEIVKNKNVQPSSKTSKNSPVKSEEVKNSEVKKPPAKMTKPVVPPKPALSVKPMLINREANPAFTATRQQPPETDTVSMALNFLKNKSSEKEKSDFRYSNSRHPPQDPIPKSRILTYFSKTLLQPEGNASGQHEKTDSGDSPRRKPAFGQLPIKPKPLTIRKTPGIEPPKLKLQTSSSHRKTQESQPNLFTRSSPKAPASSENEVTAAVAEAPPGGAKESGESKTSNDDCADDQEKCESLDEIEEKNFYPEIPEIKTEENDLACDETDFLSDLSEVENYHLLKKGNLKGEGGSIRVSRRVSFDPLALLLDAALEGELELVKKIATEVVNPSAANDEGITALHNAICAGQFEVVKFLVEFGCDVNAQDSDGWTPLHCAASCNNLPMVKFLVERGACIFATTLSDQETAAEKCEEDGAGFDGCSEYLFGLQDNFGVMNNGMVYAVYDYEVQNADELSFRNGDLLTVLRRSDDEENEWWWCCLQDREGYVPRNLLGLYPRVNSSNAQKTS